MVLAFRLHPLNRLSLPVLLNLLESAGLDENFQILLLENDARLLDFLKAGPTGLLLYSFLTPQLPEVLTEIERVKSFGGANLKLLAGGAHASGDPESCLKIGFDYVYAGPAETGFVSLLRAFLKNGLPSRRIVFRSKNLEDLDISMPISCRLKTMPPLEITRGCYWNCAFCQTACEKTIHRSAESFLRYFAELKNRNFHRRVDFICPSAFEYASASPNQLNYPAVEFLLKYCKDNGSQFIEFGIFPSEARPNTFSEPFVELIARYCSNKKITIGAQSGSDRQLKLIRRGHTVADVENACKIAAKFRLKPVVDFIMGFPGESAADRAESLALMKHLAGRYRARNQVHYFLPLAGTPLSDGHPAPLDDHAIRVLKKYKSDGICTSWWETGQILSRQIVELRATLQNVALDYDTAYL